MINFYDYLFSLPLSPQRRKAVATQWKKCKHLIIDEVSMVDGRFFRKLEAVARGVRGCDLPFGGIQLILAGEEKKIGGGDP